MTRLETTAALATLLLAFGSSAALAQSRCAQAKYKAASKKFASKAKCLGTAAARGTIPDEACMQKAEAAFAQSFAKAEARGDCLTLGDVDDVEERIDTCLTSLSAALDPPRCCAGSGPACSFANAFDCTTAGGTPGAPFSVCEGATGACTTSTPAAGNCCDRTVGCAAGPPVTEAFCDSAAGTYSVGSCTPDGCAP